MVGSDGAGSLEKLLNDGWDYHEKESERLARELEATAETGLTSNVLVPFLHLSTHTMGEHLGDWARILRLCKRVSLRARFAAERFKVVGVLPLS